MYVQYLAKVLHTARVLLQSNIFTYYSELHNYEITVGENDMTNDIGMQIARIY